MTSGNWGSGSQRQLSPILEVQFVFENTSGLPHQKHRNMAREKTATESYHTLRMAPTGRAASGIGGVTYHSALKVSCNARHYDEKIKLKSGSSGDKLKAMQVNLKGKTLLMIDEWGLVGINGAGHIARRLSEAKNGGEWFHEDVTQGYNILTFGDICQLDPVRDPGAFKDETLTGGKKQKCGKPCQEEHQGSSSRNGVYS